MGTYVVLRGNAAVVVGVQTGDLLKDVAAHTGDITEHEEGSDAGEDAEAGGKSTTNTDCQHKDDGSGKALGEAQPKEYRRLTPERRREW